MNPMPPTPIDTGFRARRSSVFPPACRRLRRARTVGVYRAMGAVALLAVTVVSLAIGAPMGTGGSRVSDPMRSLVPVDELHLHVTSAGEDLGLIGLSRNAIHDLLAERCTEDDIAVVEEDSSELPVLHFHAIVLVEDRVPDAVTYEFRLSVNQPVDLDGVDDTLRVPTYSIVYTGLEHRDDVRRVAGRNMRILISRFVQERSMAR